MTKILTVLTFVLVCGLCVAQSSPDSISYQAVVRDLMGNELGNETVTIEFAIRAGSPAGTIAFEEFHSLISTNQFGLFTAMIGNGVPTGNGQFNTLSAIPWESQIYFLEVRAAIPGQGSTQVIGVSQMLTVPYAFYASRAGTVANEADGDPENELIQDFSLSGTTLTISESDIEYSVDLSSLNEAGDTDSSNELITGMNLDNQFQLQINEGVASQTVDLDPVAHATWDENTTAIYNVDKRIGVGTTTPNSTLEVSGSLGMSVTILNGENYDLNASPTNESTVIFLCNVTTQNVTISLIPASTCPGRVYKFRKMFNNASTTNTVNIVANSGETIDGLPIYTMTNMYAEYLSIVSNGSAWYVIEHSKE